MKSFLRDEFEIIVIVGLLVFMLLFIFAAAYMSERQEFHLKANQIDACTSIEDTRERTYCINEVGR